MERGSDAVTGAQRFEVDSQYGHRVAVWGGTDTCSTPKLRLIALLLSERRGSGLKLVLYLSVQGPSPLHLVALSGGLHRSLDPSSALLT